MGRITINFSTTYTVSTKKYGLCLSYRGGTLDLPGSFDTFEEAANALEELEVNCVLDPMFVSAVQKKTGAVITSTMRVSSIPPQQS